MYINHDETIKITKNSDITRAAAAMQVAAAKGFDGIIVIGNSPTALLEALKLYENNGIKI